MSEAEQEKKGPVLISTPVDRLIELLRARKRVELSEAAREIGTSTASLTEWVAALEKEGFVTTEYRLAKAYLVWGKTSSEEIERTQEEVVEKRDAIVRMGESLLQELEKKGKEIDRFHKEFINLAKALGTGNRDAKVRLQELTSLKQRKDSLMNSLKANETQVISKMEEIETGIDQEIKSLGGIRETLKGSLRQDVSAIKVARTEVNHALTELRPEIKKFKALREFEKQLSLELHAVHELEEHVHSTFTRLKQAVETYEKKKGRLSEEAKQEALLNIRAQENTLKREFAELKSKLKSIEAAEVREKTLETKIAGVRAVEERITKDLLEVQKIVRKLSSPDVIQRTMIGNKEWEDEAKIRLEHVDVMSTRISALRSDAEKIKNEIQNIPKELDESILEKEEQLETLLGAGDQASQHFKNLLLQKESIEEAVRSVRKKQESAIDELQEIIRTANQLSELVTRHPAKGLKTGKRGLQTLGKRLDTSRERVEEFSKEHESLTQMLKRIWDGTFVHAPKKKKKTKTNTKAKTAKENAPKAEPKRKNKTPAGKRTRAGSRGNKKKKS